MYLTFCQYCHNGYNKAKGTGIIEKDTKLTLKPMPNASVLSQIPREKQIAKVLQKIIFGKKVKCPHCGRQSSVVKLVKHKVWRCNKCRKKFSLTSINWLKAMKISLQDLWLLIWCWQKQLGLQQTKNVVGLSLPTVRRYYELFRDNLQTNLEVILEGTVQMDEMFVNGAFIMGAKDTERKRIKLEVVYKKSPNKTDAMNMIFKHVKPGSKLYTDGGSIYCGCEKWWPIKHGRDIHKKGQFGLTSEIEGVWANLRTFIRRMYHHVTLKKLAKVIAEFEARFSHLKIFDSPVNFLTNSLMPVPLAF